MPKAPSNANKQDAEDEENLLRQALHAHPEDAKKHLKLGNHLFRARRYTEAEQAYTRALELDKNLAETHNNIGVLYIKINKLDESIQHFEEAVILRPDYAEAFSNLGFALARLEKHKAALTALHRAITLKPDYADAHINLASVLLSTGHFTAAWPHYAWRRQKPELKMNSHPSPRWRGEPLNGKKILIMAEQGLGDMIQAYRYVRRLQALGAFVILESPASLASLFEADGAADELVPKGSGLAWADYHVAAMDLPAVLQDDENSFSDALAYIRPDPDLLSQWSRRLAEDGGFKVGICWQGNPAFEEDQWRSFRLDEFAGLSELPGVSLYSLQKGSKGIEQIRGFSEKHVLTYFDDEDAGFTDFKGMAALASELNLIISSDTSVAHLGGALGIPTWIILGPYADWRWLKKRDDSPWYPSVRLFRQTRAGSWHSVFEEVRSTLQEQLQNPASLPVETQDISHAEQAYQNGNSSQAIQTCLALLKTGHSQAAHNLLGMIYGARKKFDLAIVHLERLRQEDPKTTGLNNLGLCFYNTRQFQRAVSCFKAALKAEETYAADISAIHNNLGLAYTGTGQLTEAETHFRQALSLEPDNCKIWADYGIALKKAGRLDAAEEALRKALTLNPDYADAHYNLGVLLLLQGRNSEGWVEYQWRLQRTDAIIRSHSSPVWEGQPLDNKSLLILAEQGTGDMIQALRFIAHLKTGGSRIIVETSRSLQGLFKSCQAIDQVVFRDQKLPDADYHIPMMSLPAVLGLDSGQFSDGRPYLHAEPRLVRQWGKILGKKSACRIGIVWQGNPDFWEDHWRSIPLKEFLALDDLTDIELISLQKGDAANWQLASLESGSGIRNIDQLTGKDRDFMDTAAIIMNLDLVITSDTSVAHLAGALGAKTWLLLGRFPDWRWLRQTETSPWYPSMRLFRQAEPGNWSASFHHVLLALGEMLKQEKPDAAQAAFLRLIKLDPANPSAYISLGMLLEEREEPAQALQYYRQAAKVSPDSALVFYCIGNACKKLQLHNDAIRAYQQALRLKPDLADASYNLGNVFSDEEQYADAELCFRRVLELKPGNIKALINLGYALEQQFRLQDAETTNRQVLALEPGEDAAHLNIGNVLKKTGRHTEAEAAYREAIRLKPDSVDAHFNLSTLLLLEGRFKEGWPEYRWRLKRKKADISSHDSALWAGEKLTGKTLLILAEQGLGDMLQGVRYVKHLKAENNRIVLECHRTLIDLFSCIPEIDQLISKGSALPPADFHIPIMDIPGVLGDQADDFSRHSPYLQIDPEAVRSWKEKLGPSRKFRIGIVWQGNPAFPNNRVRSLPLAEFSILCEDPGIELVSLQKGEHATSQIGNFKQQFPLLVPDDLTTKERDFVDTAAIMLNMDMVICSDTSVAHLAGALAVPAWVLLSKMADWRWLLEREDSPWYPSMRLFRQERQGDWSSVLKQVKQALTALSTRH